VINFKQIDIQQYIAKVQLHETAFVSDIIQSCRNIRRFLCTGWPTGTWHLLNG